MSPADPYTTNRARYYVPPGRMRDHTPAHPERTSLRDGRTWDADTEYQVWTNRPAMLRAVRMAESGPNPTHLRPYQP
jgi:hypothetical protein